MVNIWLTTILSTITINHLVGGFNHLEKYESQWEGLSHILWKIKKCLKPPTRLVLTGIIHSINGVSSVQT